MKAQFKVIGIVNKPTGTMLTDADGNLVEETIKLDGYHVNATGIIPEWDDYLLDGRTPDRAAPTTPQSLYPGGKTVFYRFQDQATFDVLNPQQEIN